MRRAWTAWIAGVALGLSLGVGFTVTGCVGGPPPPPIDASDSTVGVSSSAGTVVSDPTTTTTVGTTTTTGPVDGSWTSGLTRTSTGGDDCDFQCPPGVECIDGVCVGNTGGSSSSGGTKLCPLAVELSEDMILSEACVECLEAGCCEELQACFGEDVSRGPTQCGMLNDCILANCAMVGSSERLQECINANCSEFDGYDPWSAYQQCAASQCLMDCSQ